MCNVTIIVHKTMLYILKLFRVNFKSSHHTKKLSLRVVMNVMYTFCHDHFTIIIYKYMAYQVHLKLI